MIKSNEGEKKERIGVTPRSPVVFVTGFEASAVDVAVARSGGERLKEGRRRWLSGKGHALK